MNWFVIQNSFPFWFPPTLMRLSSTRFHQHELCVAWVQVVCIHPHVSLVWWAVQPYRYSPCVVAVSGASDLCAAAIFPAFTVRRSCYVTSCFCDPLLAHTLNDVKRCCVTLVDQMMPSLRAPCTYWWKLKGLNSTSMKPKPPTKTCFILKNRADRSDSVSHLSPQVNHFYYRNRSLKERNINFKQMIIFINFCWTVGQLHWHLISHCCLVGANRLVSNLTKSRAAFSLDSKVRSGWTWSRCLSCCLCCSE